MDRQYLDDIDDCSTEAMKVFDTLSGDAKSEARMLAAAISMAFIARTARNDRFDSETLLKIQTTALEACLIQARASMEALKRLNAREGAR